MILKQTALSRMSETCMKMYMNIGRITNPELNSRRLIILFCWHIAALSSIENNFLLKAAECTFA